MPSIVSNLVVIVGLVAFLITAAAAIGATYKTNRNTTTVNSYRESALSWQSRAEALEARQKTQEERIENLCTDLAAKETEIAQCSSKIETLSDMVTGKSAIEHLAADISQAFTKAFARQEEMLAQANAIRAEVRALREEARRGR